MNLRKGYSDGPEGQVHWCMATPDGAASAGDIYCFSPAPFSSIAYADLLPHLAKDHRIIAPDYPGQGGSDGGSSTPSIASYAASMLAVIEDLSADRPVTVLGFHSGCLVAAELQAVAPARIDHAVFIDVPAFDPDTRAKFLPMVGQPFEPSASIEALAKAWDMAVTKRLQRQSIEDCYAMFADTVGNGPRMNATFHAAFTYEVEARFSAVQGRTTILATQSSLLESSRRAAQLIEGATLVERLDIEGSVLNANAARTAEAILTALNAPPA